jgi:hypothetical protein
MGSTGLQFPELDEAIANVEGFNSSTSNWSQINNNPGNIIAGVFANNNGATGSNGGFAVFPDADTGTQAEDNLIGQYAGQGATLEQMLAAWAPGSVAGNDPTSYTNQVSAATGVAPNAPVASANTSGLNTLSNIFGPSAASAITQANSTGTATAGNVTAALSSGATSPTGVISYGYRIATFIVGLMFLGAGLFMLRGGSVINVTTSAVKGAVAP